jgi:hypothetical protein
MISFRKQLTEGRLILDFPCRRTFLGTFSDKGNREF